MKVYLIYQIQDEDIIDIPSIHLNKNDAHYRAALLAEYHREDTEFIVIEREVE